MNRLQLAVTPLRILLVLLFVALVAGQALLAPEVFDLLADENEKLQGLKVVLMVVCVLGLLCVQVVVACIWKLLGLVTSDRIFSDGALVWVDVIVWAIAAAWSLLLGAFVAVVATIGFAGLGAGLMLLLLAGGVLGLLMVVMRALLRQATTLRVEMEAVI